MNIKINWNIVLDELQFTLIEELKKNAPIHDGDIRNSLSATVNDNQMMIYAIKYALAIDSGTIPFMPPVDSLEKWAKDKLGDENLKWAIAYKIKKYGLKPSWFIRDTIEQHLPRLLADALRQEGAIELIRQVP